MLTPVFRLEQNDKHLIIKIRAPYCKLSSAEVSYEGRDFVFNASPYFLRLFLPGDVIDDETGTCDYDVDSGECTICVPKKNRCEFFQRLEMLSELLKPQQRMPTAMLPIEIINSRRINDEPRSSTGKASDNNDDESDSEEDGENVDSVLLSDGALYAEQKIASIDSETGGSIAATCSNSYGFGWIRHGVLGKFQEDLPELIDLDDPENVSIAERLTKLREFDERRFQEQHYLADLFTPEQLQIDAMEFEFDENLMTKLNEEDRRDLKDLRVRQLETFSQEVEEKIALSLVDIIFGFAYDFRTTLGEHTVESGWTISKLAPSLTFLVQWPAMFDAVCATVRHSLVLPLFRNWQLSVKVLEDVQRILEFGRPAILHCLLTCRRIFNQGGEFRYLLNQLFLDDLCLWIQSVAGDEWLDKLLKEFKNSLGRLTKSDILELDLEFVEAQARLVMLKTVDSDEEEK